MPDERRSVVAAGYDAIAGRYLEWSSRVLDPARDRMLGEFTARLPRGADVLDLGCGAGIPSTRTLAARFKVTGLDVSTVQIAAARHNVPTASFVQADMMGVELPAGSFDGVTALHTISHLPRGEHGLMLRKIAAWLRPDGLLLITMGACDSPDWTGAWLGTTMFFSSFDAAINRRLVAEADFDVLRADVVETIEPEGPVPFLWVLARRAVA